MAEKYRYTVRLWHTPQGADRWKVQEHFASGEVRAIFGGFRDEAHATRIADALNKAEKEE